MKVLISCIVLMFCVVLTKGQNCNKTRRKPGETGEIEYETYSGCCEGYTWVKGICTPLCRTRCVNAVCTSPNFCTCNPGYERVDNFRCKKENRNPTTKFDDTIPDLNKTKTKTDENLNHESSDYSDTTSEIDVESEMEMEYSGDRESTTDDSNVSVTSIKTLTENESSEDSESTSELENVSENNQESCDPENNCKNRKCMEKYKLENEKCEPQCDEECLNSKCVEPDLCACSEGFTGSSTCKLMCTEENPICVNGTCNEPESCRCFEGFNQNPYNASLCSRAMSSTSKESGTDIGLILLYVIIAITLITGMFFLAWYGRAKKQSGSYKTQEISQDEDWI